MENALRDNGSTAGYCWVRDERESEKVKNS